MSKSFPHWPERFSHRNYIRKRHWPMQNFRNLELLESSHPCKYSTHERVVLAGNLDMQVGSKSVRTFSYQNELMN